MPSSPPSLSLLKVLYYFLLISSVFVNFFSETRITKTTVSTFPRQSSDLTDRQSQASDYSGGGGGGGSASNLSHSNNSNNSQLSQSQQIKITKRRRTLSRSGSALEDELFSPEPSVDELSAP
jgi:hypothetical protein